MPTSTQILARSSTTFTLPDTICSRICHKVMLYVSYCWISVGRKYITFAVSREIFIGNTLYSRWSQKESQISLCFQDFNENFARQLEDRSRKPYQPKDNDFGSLRNPWSMHMGTRNKRCLNLSSFDYQLRTIHTVCF